MYKDKNNIPTYIPTYMFFFRKIQYFLKNLQIMQGIYSALNFPQNTKNKIYIVAISLYFSLELRKLNEIHFIKHIQ